MGPHAIQRTQEIKEQFKQSKITGEPFPHDGYIWGHVELWWRDEDE